MVDPAAQASADELLSAAREHFAGIELPVGARESFVERARALGLVGSPPSSRLFDLYLAAAAAEGQPEAIARIDGEIQRLLPAARKVGLSDADLEEVAQLVRIRLFSPSSAASGIRGYAGRGALGAWLRAAIIKTALRHRETQRAHVPVADADEALMSALLPDRPTDVELDKQETMVLVRRVLCQSLDSLDPDSRRLLREHVLDGQSIDVLAAEQGVHRSTVARRVNRACALLRRAVVRNLAQADCCGRGEASALLSWVDSQLDLSLSRLLPKSTAPARKNATDGSCP